MPTRRMVCTGLAAGLYATAAHPHALYNQWVVYRKKHLLIGSHRQDGVTYDLAKEVVRALHHFLPEAKARPARAPHAERLASLLGTGQMDIAILAAEDVEAMRNGAGRFAPYGRIPLTLVMDLGDRVLVAVEAFPPHHAWLVSEALTQMGWGLVETETGLLRHPGAEAQRAGIAYEDLVQP